MSKRYVEASLSSGVKLYRVPIHFPGNLFNTSSTSKHVSVMFKGEGTVPCGPGSAQLVEFMVEKGFGSGIAITSVLGCTCTHTHTCGHTHMHTHAYTQRVSLIFV